MAATALAKTGAPAKSATAPAAKRAPAAQIFPAPPPATPGPLRALNLRLPTDNRSLLEGKPDEFYMGVDRTIDGQSRLVWEGGQYGFVRNPFKLGEETVYTRFHEGVDIAPTVRDNRGEPLDLVRAIDAGRVVFASDNPRASNYGNYVVVEHDWGCGTFYSLYAHLARVDAKAGEPITSGGVLGKLGHTGSGLDRRRAHVHLEINLLLSDRFEVWQQQTDPDSLSARTPFHGHNLAGLDVAGLFLALKEDPELRLPAFFARQAPYFQVLAPNKGIPSLLRRYPWLCPEPLAAETPINAPSWQIAFSASGLPLSLRPSRETTPYPVITAVVPHEGKHSWRTLNRVGGTGAAAQLTRKGTEYVNLVLGAF